jgi:GNAT superfamily N-acetyltransferase
MVTIHHGNVYNLVDYSNHLKNLTEQDKLSRFGYIANDHTIDKFILQLVYKHSLHELWYATIDNNIVGWGHLANNNDGTWELAVSVDFDFQRQGIGSKLIGEMLAWAKFHHVKEVFMHCIEENQVIQHLAQKHSLKTRERGAGSRTAAIEVPKPNLLEANQQLWKESSEILEKYRSLNKQLADIWTLPIILK